MTSEKNNGLKTYYIIIGIILLAVYLYDKYGDSLDLDKLQERFEQELPLQTDRETIREEKRKAMQQAQQPLPLPQPQKPFGRDIDFYTVQRFGPVIPDDGQNQILFRQHYAAKLANRAYIKSKNRRGLPKGYQDYPEEELIKEIRSRIAAQLATPEGVSPAVIPIISTPPAVDGNVSPAEWNDAIALSIGGSETGTRIYLASDGKQLYLACTVPDDQTTMGYDQFRFYYHLGIIPELVNERIHVDRSGRATALRATRIRWTGTPPGNDEERWKKSPISDWHIYEKHKGGSSLYHHRQYELSLDLEETGLHPGVPFPARFEVETDPARDAKGKFKHRNYLGTLGTKDNPFWFVIEK